MRQPPGYEDKLGHVCKSDKALYGLKQHLEIGTLCLVPNFSLLFFASKAYTSLFFAAKGGVYIHSHLY
jgi:hypothetical protein